MRTMAGLRRTGLPTLALLTAIFALAATTGSAAPSPLRGRLVEVVVTLPQPPLAVAERRSLDLRAARSVSYLHTLAAAQAQFTARLATVVPAARVNWHYGVALDGVAVVVPASQLSRLSSIPGATVWPTVTYHSLGGPAVAPKVQAGPDNRPPQLIGATSLWGNGFKGE